MQPIKSFFYILLLLAVCIESCSVEKRRYTNGYHLQWKHKVKTTSSEKEVATLKPEKNTKKTEVVSEEKQRLLQNTNAIYASSDKKQKIYLFPADSIGCDTLILKDGAEIKVKVTEITPTEVKYKHCNNLNGPTYVVYRYEVSYIKYKNGSLDSFVDEHPPMQKQSKNDNYNNRDNYNDRATEQYVKTHSLASLILGIISFPLLYIGVGVITAIIAVSIARKCLRLIKQDPQNLWIYSKRATAGLVLGWVILGLIILSIAILLIALVIFLAGI